MYTQSVYTHSVYTQSVYTHSEYIPSEYTQSGYISMCISESYKSIDLPSVKKYKKSIPKKYGFGDNNWKDEIKAKKKNEVVKR